MKLKVRLFAAYREAVGAPRVELPLDDGADAQAVWAALADRYPALRSLPAPSGYAVNDEYVAGDRRLRDTDEVALIPPVSGGEAFIELTEGPISTDRVLREVSDPKAGAVVLFLGVVRDNARGRRVDHLLYEAYETLARREIAKIAATVADRWPVARVAIVHRTGRVGVGEPTVAIAVSAPHRREAFEAGRFAIDTLKMTVPIWKKEVWEGGAAWIGSQR